MNDGYSFTPLDSFKSNPTHCKDVVLDAFFISKNAMDNNFIKNLDVIVDTVTNSDHYLVTTVVDTVGLHSTSVPLVKKIGRKLKQINFESLRYDQEQSDIIQLVLQCQNLNDSIVVYNDILIKTKVERGTPFKRHITKAIKQTSKFTVDITKSRKKRNHQLHA